MSAEMEAVLKKVRARQELTDAEKVMARRGLLAETRRDAVVAVDSTPRGDGIDRAAMWAKAMKGGRGAAVASPVPRVASSKRTTSRPARSMSQDEINAVWAKAMKHHR